MSDSQTFEEWLNGVRRNSRQDAGYLDNHVRPMAEIVLGGAKVVKLEKDLQQVEQWLDEITQSTWPRGI